jgi:hypothetical protein
VASGEGTLDYSFSLSLQVRHPSLETSAWTKALRRRGGSRSTTLVRK